MPQKVCEINIYILLFLIHFVCKIVSTNLDFNLHIFFFNRHRALTKTNVLKQLSSGTRGVGEVQTLNKVKFPLSQNQQSKDDDGLFKSNGLLEVQDTTKYYELDQCLITSAN